MFCVRTRRSERVVGVVVPESDALARQWRHHGVRAGAHLRLRRADHQARHRGVALLLAQPQASRHRPIEGT